MNETPVSWIRLPAFRAGKLISFVPPLSIRWIAFSLALLYPPHVIAVWSSKPDDLYLLPALAATLLFADVAFVPAFVKDKLSETIRLLLEVAAPVDEDLDEFTHAREEEISNIFRWSGSWNAMLWVGLPLAAAIEVPLILFAGPSFDVPPAVRIVDYSVATGIMLFGAAAVSRLPPVIVLYHRLYRGLRLKAAYIRYPPRQLKVVSGISFQMALWAIFGYVMLGLFWVTFPDFFLQWEIIAAYMAFGALLVLVISFVPQWQLHRLMREYKYEQIEQFRPQAREALDRVANEPYPEGFRRLAEFTQAERSLSEIREWPFDLSAVPNALGIMVAPFVAPLVLGFLELTFR